MSDYAITGTSTTEKTGNGSDANVSHRGLQAVGKQFGAGAGAAAGTATNLAQTAQEYAGKVSDAASHATDYVSDKVGVVSEKIKDLSKKDFGEITSEAKEFARRNPGQAILISAVAGLLLGLFVRGRR
jgi:ElaB/YqjD/DUF883 family membrane-anchored ribosome-binding protein